GRGAPPARAARWARAGARARCAPAGARGACPVVRAGGYGVADWPAFAAEANRELLLIALIEDAAGLSVAEEIARDPGVDALFVGAFDLAVSLGLPPGELRSAGLLGPFEAVLAAAQGKPVMASAGVEGSDYGQWLLAKGVRILSCGADLQIVHRTARRLRAELGSRQA
ncbi:MAG: aldolase/citrate lyase family protein, partial [Tistlia sp.]